MFLGSLPAKLEWLLCRSGLVCQPPCQLFGRLLCFYELCLLPLFLGDLGSCSSDHCLVCLVIFIRAPLHGTYCHFVRSSNPIANLWLLVFPIVKYARDPLAAESWKLAPAAAPATSAAEAREAARSEAAGLNVRQLMKGLDEMKVPEPCGTRPILLKVGRG